MTGSLIVLHGLSGSGTTATSPLGCAGSVWELLPNCTCNPDIDSTYCPFCTAQARRYWIMITLVRDIIHVNIGFFSRFCLQNQGLHDCLVSVELQSSKSFWSINQIQIQQPSRNRLRLHISGSGSLTISRPLFYHQRLPTLSRVAGCRASLIYLRHHGTPTTWMAASPSQ